MLNEESAESLCICLFPKMEKKPEEENMKTWSWKMSFHRLSQRRTWFVVRGQEFTRHQSADRSSEEEEEVWLRRWRIENRLVVINTWLKCCYNRHMDASALCVEHIHRTNHRAGRLEMKHLRVLFFFFLKNHLAFRQYSTKSFKSI